MTLRGGKRRGLDSGGAQRSPIITRSYRVHVVHFMSLIVWLFYSFLHTLVRLVIVRAGVTVGLKLSLFGACPRPLRLRVGQFTNLARTAIIPHQQCPSCQRLSPLSCRPTLVGHAAQDLDLAKRRRNLSTAGTTEAGYRNGGDSGSGGTALKPSLAARRLLATSTITRHRLIEWMRRARGVAQRSRRCQ